MNNANQDAIKVQTIIEGIPAWLYKILKKGLRGRALEMAIILLAEDEQLRKIFFQDPQVVEAILNSNKEKVEPTSKIVATKSETKIETETGDCDDEKLEDMDRWAFKVK